MRNPIVMAALVTVAGCSNARAASPDSDNPAHCLAAFNYAAYWFKVGNEPEKVAEHLARGMYILQKVKSAGGSQAQVLAQAKQFSLGHVKDSKVMDGLYVACGTSQAEDPQFRTEFADLIEKARPLVAKFGPAPNP